MNFENIKNQMDSEGTENTEIPQSIKNLKHSNMPIEKVRKTMRGEIITQLVCIIIFFAVPSLVKLHPLAKSVYYILMFVTSIMTLGYLAKMIWFLKKTKNMDLNSRDMIINYIHNLNITLEVYKTAIIAGSMLLPLSLIALLFGLPIFNESIFIKIIHLNLSPIVIVISALSYIIISIVFYFVTVVWADNLYGVHITKLKQILGEFDN